MKINEVIEPRETPGANQYQRVPLSHIGVDVDTVSDAVDRQFSAIRKTLVKQCSEILSVYKKSRKLLYRGVKENNRAFFAKIRPDRVPGWLARDDHDLINKVIVQMGGTAHRGNSIFCSTRKNFAEAWGTKFIVFPTNGWSVTYSNETKGLYMYDHLTHASKWMPDTMNPAGRTPEAMVEKKLQLIGVNFSKSEMPEFMDSDVWEYMIAGDSYIGLEVSFYEAAIQKWLFNRTI